MHLYKFGMQTLPHLNPAMRHEDRPVLVHVHQCRALKHVANMSYNYYICRRSVVEWSGI